jgi:hypothetical protein
VDPFSKATPGAPCGCQDPAPTPDGSGGSLSGELPSLDELDSALATAVASTLSSSQGVETTDAADPFGDIGASTDFDPFGDDVLGSDPTEAALNSMALLRLLEMRPGIKVTFSLG